MDFLKGAKDFTRNPLGIIALFISLIYGFASLLLGSAAEKLTPPERWPLVVFIVFFPVMVLFAFYKLVTKHHGKLYAPGDFKDDKSFLRTLSFEEQERKLDAEVKESLEIEQVNSAAYAENKSSSGSLSVRIEDQEARSDEQRRFREEIHRVEQAVIKMIAMELKTQASLNVGIADTDAQFDAFLEMIDDKATFLEVKVFRSPLSALAMLDRVLYSAVIADKFFASDFKLIVAAVYSFEDSELERVKRVWGRKVDRCPADVELRFIPRAKLENI